MDDKKIYLDANVLIEILESRPKNKTVEKIIRESADYVYISALTYHIVTYVCTKRVDLKIIEKFLGDYKILPLTSDEVEWAIKNRRNEDFEDALHIAIAIRNGCSEFLTLDKELARDYYNLPTLKIKLL